ncbi:hypothetical protein JZ785_11460 [Alicyclobacillus curvatus]|jgi:hypothetical protein|nr:hypothetical protein JZ785_11460 [Alicyclobacillus curvatus]
MWTAQNPVLWLIGILIIGSFIVAFIQMRKTVEENKQQLGRVVEMLEDIQGRLSDNKEIR